MHTDTPQERKPTGSANNPAGYTDHATIPNTAGTIKAALIRFASWLAMMFRGVV